MNLEPVRPKILSCQTIPQAHADLVKSLNLDPRKHTSLGLVTCDQDDSLYAALDHATKYAPIDVVYAKSFYAGANHASGPFSGESIGVIAAATPEDINEGLFALEQAIEKDISFFQFGDKTGGPTFFPHVIASLGHYLAKEAGVAPGTAMAYLIAPPMESVIGIDAALKAAKVRMVKHFGPPTETNFGGGYLVGDLHEVEAARAAFVEGVRRVALAPVHALKKPERFRR
ncbi:MAG: ethanolamine utilization microcompartment protein EutL [Bdellovibrionales bacterium]|nr:ethanolamine utilization microcompartment protein EutL [Bdellovibrionales bacterium]